MMQRTHSTSILGASALLKKWNKCKKPDLWSG